MVAEVRAARNLALIAAFVAVAIGLFMLWFSSVGYDPRCLVVKCVVVVNR